jgi:hypothetical protein
VNDHKHQAVDRVSAWSVVPTRVVALPEKLLKY